MYLTSLHDRDRNLQLANAAKQSESSVRAGPDELAITCKSHVQLLQSQSHSKSLRVPCPSGKHVKGMLKLASASVGGQVVLASSNDDRNPPENIVDG